MTKDEALDLALEALELSAVTVDSFGVQKKTQEAITAIKQALAAPVREPVWIQPDHLQKAQRAPFLCRVEPHKRDDFVPLYTTPPAAQRPFVGLTDEERTEIRREHYARTLPLMDAVEAKLRSKNNG